MTKQALLMVLAALPALPAFGMDFSLGAGGLAGGLFTRYTLEAEGEIAVPVDIRSAQEVNQFNYGGFLFADATWVELCLGFQGGNNVWHEHYSANTKDGITLTDQPAKGTGQEAMFSLGLLGKYPFRLNKRLTLFPLAGLEYQIALLEYRDPEVGPLYNRTNGTWEKDANGNAYTLAAWNSLLVDVGAGLDIALYHRLFLRAELLYGFRLQTPFELDALEKVKKMANAPKPRLGGLTSGPTLKIALGYRLLGL
jgi:opacity protein-like surface antigen